jgi:two-component system alkaline phosphatase synthesis response regulator PhoP
MAEPNRILLIDDEPDILEFLGYSLTQEGFAIEKATNGGEGIRLALQFKPDLILLDLMMPGIDGIETCEQIRKLPDMKDVLIAFLTARGEDYSQIAGFTAGGDDYIIKPIKTKVLISRINALLRRRKSAIFQLNEDHLLKFGNLIIDRMKYLVTISGQEQHLPKKEFELLILLASKPGRMQTREDIFGIIWGDHAVIGERTIDVHIRKLREKIGEDCIQTIKGVGYRFTLLPSNKNQFRADSCD